MTEENERSAIASKTVVYSVPGMAAVSIQHDLAYATSAGSTLAFDSYLPRARGAAGLPPVVVFVAGYPDPNGKLKTMGAYTSWARLLAASGVAAITYANRNPVLDLQALLIHIESHAHDLGVDAKRLAIWSCSGNAPTALSLLTNAAQRSLACLVFCYPFLLDTPSSTAVADSAARFGFVDACRGRAVTDLARNAPVLIVRAGADQMPGLNAALDQFVSAALACDLPLSLINHAGAPHAFDILDDSAKSREVIRRIVSFLDVHLGIDDGTFTASHLNGP